MNAPAPAQCPEYLLYLHGFRSSPRSYKARVVQERLTRAGLAGKLICPQLPASPRAAMELVLTLVERHARADANRVAIVGSSLGGFYATWLAERFGCRAALVNPAVDPLKNLEQHVGVTTAWHSDAPFEFKRDYIDELAALKIAGITRPQRYYLLAATGDEVLDYRDMLAHYAGAPGHLIQGGDHAVSDFERYVDAVLAFCGFAAADGTEGAAGSDPRQ
ncbi:alpha/beta fold hydrolase [Massilia forsythiae]|uniref:Alpha/beta fold hydrolase n=1 Tax=Massilia forsythiae TaxID=2728020 RepID=A0A7Z2VWL9_9BURK|nr:YqiA/YcfP family alpha/beta fold hydrolase [Massilia forsythiae]QJE00591.1 alpha/beta fold hydrolase [Massilia forsythiae]